VTVARAQISITFPARFILVGAMNPCPCGYFMDEKKLCRCSPGQIRKYLNKISGPLLDRFDIQIEVINQGFVDLVKRDGEEESSSQIRERIQAARDIQTRRFKGKNIFCNAQMLDRDLTDCIDISNSAISKLKFAIEKLKFSTRSYTRILKLARTIADLDGASRIEIEHISEAIQYRCLDKETWFH
jgi:magnesium chelatase family protein